MPKIPLHTIQSVAQKKWDAIIIGGGHNGLVSAAYLAKAGKRVCVLEKRHVIGGAAVTEEIFPGFRYSRASYVFSLFRPHIIKDLELKRHGLTVYARNPSSFTPCLDGQSLLLGSDMEQNQREIAKFSKKDAAMFPKYNQMLEGLVDFFTPMLDEIPPDPKIAFDSTNRDWKQRAQSLASLAKLGYRTASLGKDMTTFVEFMTAPASKILNRWFESDILKATLATDAIIGAKVSPHTPGSAYVLFHHVMGELDGVKGMWGHVRGGMGSVSNAIAASGIENGVNICTSAPVDKINIVNGQATGVTMTDGTVIHAHQVLSNVPPSTTFLNLVGSEYLPEDVVTHFRRSWYAESASTKINLALKQVPNFTCKPNTPHPTNVMPHHRGTIHFESTVEEIETAFRDVEQGLASKRPVIEMNIPTSLDDSIAPPGQHVALLFVQYTPYAPKDGPWTEARKDEFATRVFDVIEEYAPGFKDSILHYEILTPPDLEREFSLPKGNIFHGSMGLDQLLWLRPMGGYSNYRTPIPSLYLCSAGTHPGGGVMGAPGSNAAQVCLQDSFKIH